MANFAAQLKDRFLGLVDRVTGCGRAGVKEEATGTTKSAPVVQEVHICTFCPNFLHCFCSTPRVVDL
jgi:hypothetical protein